MKVRESDGLGGCSDKSDAVSGDGDVGIKVTGEGDVEIKLRRHFNFNVHFMQFKTV